MPAPGEAEDLERDGAFDPCAGLGEGVVSFMVSVGYARICEADGWKKGEKVEVYVRVKVFWLCRDCEVG